MWTSKIFPDDKLDGGLVASMLGTLEPAPAAEESSVDQPLWKLMEATFLEGRKPGHCDRLGYATEIEAVRDWLVPETSRGRWIDAWRVELFHRLTAEAERARRGE
jgi:hypothetical protein